MKELRVRRTIMILVKRLQKYLLDLLVSIEKYEYHIIFKAPVFYCPEICLEIYFS